MGVYRCLGAQAGLTPRRAGAELCAAAALGCGLWCEPCGTALSLPQVTRAQPELPLHLGVGRATSCHPLLDTGLGLAGAAQAAAACESLSQCGPGAREQREPCWKLLERKMENPLLLLPQLNISASKDKPYYKVMKSEIKEDPQKASKPGAKQKRNRLSLLLQKPEFHEGDHLGKPGNLKKAASVSPEEAVKWGESFDKLLSEKAGLDVFTKFLKTEFSEENIEFWIACEDYKKSKSAHELLPKAKTIFETFIQKDAPREVNLDFHTKEVTRQSIVQPLRGTFDAAQSTVYRLMEQDSYPRFLSSALYLGLLQGRAPARAPLRRRSRSFTVSDFQGTRPDFTVCAQRSSALLNPSSHRNPRVF